MKDPIAIQELARDPSSRKRFLKLVGGAGAAGALSVFLAACGGDDEGPSTAEDKTAARGTKGDLETVNYALRLEYLERAFYDQVIRSDQITDEKITDALKGVLENEREHVDSLTASAKKLGGRPSRPPKTDFDSIIEGGQEKILPTAATIENLGAAAYLGAVDKIQSKEVLASMLEIHSVEGRHAALLNFFTGKPVTPDGPFARPATEAEVLKQVEPFIAGRPRRGR